MEIFSDINSLFSYTFSRVKYSMVLTLPFLTFWLLLGFILLPLTSGGQGVIFTIILLVGLTAAFMSGWLNMFKKCAEFPVDENLSEDKRTVDSFSLFSEFFPGVGKNFGKMALGVIIYFFLFNIMILVIEVAIIPIFGSFESFSPQEMMKALETPDKTIAFWNEISESDKSRIFQIAVLEFIFGFLFVYLTMFWAQLVILRDFYPLKAIAQSVKTVINDPVRTGIIFFLNFILVLTVFFAGAILIVNPVFKLVMILVFVYALVFYVMATFLYLERYTEPEQEIKTNNN